MIPLKKGKYYLVVIKNRVLKEGRFIIKITGYDQEYKSYHYDLIAEITGSDSPSKQFGKASNWRKEYIKREISEEEVFAEIL